MNCSLVDVDRMTHVKIVLVALIASTAVIAAGVYARPTEADFTVGRIEADQPVIRAAKPRAISDRYGPDRRSM